MADSNTRRARQRQKVIYMPYELAALLERVAEASGETESTHVRAALRTYLRKLARELGIAEGAKR